MLTGVLGSSSSHREGPSDQMADDPEEDLVLAPSSVLRIIVLITSLVVLPYLGYA